MSYSIEGTQRDCYPNTTVLINKLNITNQKELDEIERQLILFVSTNLEKSVAFENVSFEFYKNLHRKLFEELYEWAGTIRSINISKKGTAFCDYNSIEKIGKLKFKRLQNMNYLQDLNKSDFLDEVTELYNDLNMLHPFREGNGRTLRLFITLLVRNAGYEINFANCDGDLLTIATIKAAQGDFNLLKEVLAEIIK